MIYYTKEDKMKNNNDIFLWTLALFLLAGMVCMTLVTYHSLPKKPVDMEGLKSYHDFIRRKNQETRKWLT
jgi:hypothetical protein